MKKAAGEGDFLFHAAGELGREEVRFIGEIQLLEKVARMVGSVIDLVKARGEFEVLAHAEVVE